MQDKFIIDEDNQIISAQDLINKIDLKQKDPKNLNNPDNFTYSKNIEGYRFSYSDFSQEVIMEELTLDQIQEIVNSINMVRVFSTNLIALGYNTEKKILRVIFKGNSSYLYFNVEPDIWEIISQSESKGKTLRETIIKEKDKYKYIKL